jgi:glycosyltransferase involved in cell wall biosynthesis
MSYLQSLNYQVSYLTLEGGGFQNDLRMVSTKKDKSRFKTYIHRLFSIYNWLKANPRTVVITKELQSEYVVFGARFILWVQDIHFRHISIRPSFGFRTDSLWHLIKNCAFYFSCYFVDVNIAVSAHVKGCIMRFIPNPARTITIANSVPSLANAKVSFQQPVRLLYTGKLSQRKNVIELLQAVYLLSGDYVLDIVGDGVQRLVLEKYVVQHHLTNKVFFHGYRNDVTSFLTCSDIFILPSLKEGLSLSLLEAMAAGLACVVSRNGSNESIVKHGKNGLLYEIGDYISLAKKLKQVLNSEQLRVKLQRGAQRTIEKGYLDATQFAQYKQLIDSL